MYSVPRSVNTVLAACILDAVLKIGKLLNNQALDAKDEVSKLINALESNPLGVTEWHEILKHQNPQKTYRVVDDVERDVIEELQKLKDIRDDKANINLRSVQEFWCVVHVYVLTGGVPSKANVA